nr:MAG TPA: hypothetical protein [Caudoviricetes sp.]
MPHKFKNQPERKSCQNKLFIGVPALFDLDALPNSPKSAI